MLKDLLRVSIQNGKYTVAQRFNGTLEVLRHKQYWRDETGDNLILGLAQEVENLREVLYTIQDLQLLDPRDKEFEEVADKITELLKEYESDEKEKSQCKKCSGKMKRGIALENVLSGIPDFIGRSGVCTVSLCPEAKIIPVLKCERCGRSEHL